MGISTSSLGKVRYNVRGVYNTSDSYTVDDIVNYGGGQYLCKINNSSGSYIPGQNASYWEKISGLTRDRGNWSSSTAYQVNDIVTYIHEYAYNSCWKYYDTSTYICRQAHTNNNPATALPIDEPTTQSTYWYRLSKHVSRRVTSFLGKDNEGYSPPYKPIWNAKSQSVIGTINTLYITGSGSGWLTSNRVKGKTGSPKTGMIRLTASGASGSGFEGVAHINSSGQIFQCEIINPGKGYTGSPSINIDTSVSGYTGRSGGSNPSFGTYVTTNSTAGATGTSVLVGMGDSIGPAKTYGTHNPMYDYGYINRRGGWVAYGRDYYKISGIAKNDNDAANTSAHNEGNFCNLDYIDGLLPTPDGEYPKVIQVEHGQGNTLWLFNNGEVHYSGYNGYGEAGDNRTTDTGVYHPARCGYANVNKSGTTALRGKKAIRIASCTGGNTSVNTTNYALIENTNGTRDLYAWGYNGYGQIGDSTTSTRTVPTQISFNPSSYGRIVEIWATGGTYGYLFVLTDRGHLYAVGYNGYGQLGQGDTSNRSNLSSSRVDSNAFGTLTGTNQRVKKLSLNGSGSHGFNALVRGDGSVYTWGYNGYGNLGHNHTNRCQVPIRVRTSGYSSPSNPVTSTSNQGSGAGSNITDCVDYWTCGGNSHVFSYMTRGSSITNNTLYACGYNGYYNLSNSSNNTSNASTFQTVRYRNNSTFTNCMMVVSNQGHNSSYISIAAYRYNSTFAARKYDNPGEWYYGAYNHGRVDSESYNYYRDNDPDYVQNNYRMKPGQREPYANYGNWFFHTCGQSSSKMSMWADLRTGQVFHAQNPSMGNPGYVSSMGGGSGNGGMKRLRNSHY
jgi:alpha-tubulin suppressor-like RCC1 family protein